MAREQRIRIFLYYVSVVIFVLGLPFILSFALSYRFSPHTLRFIKTGLMDIKTQPQGASVYFQGKPLATKTPAAINELMPGIYTLRIELEKYYPWTGEVKVEAGKVTRLDKIILFPLRPNITQLNKAWVSSFSVDKEKEKIYYLSQEDRLLYVSNLAGEKFQEAGKLPENFVSVDSFKVSPDKERVLCYNSHQILIMSIEPANVKLPLEPPIVLEYPAKRIVDAFWHSDGYHIIVVTNKNIEAVEAKVDPVTVNLAQVNRKAAGAFYDEKLDTLYFLDQERGEDGRLYDNVYKLELDLKFYPLREFMNLKSNE